MYRVLLALCAVGSAYACVCALAVTFDCSIHAYLQPRTHDHITTSASCLHTSCHLPIHTAVFDQNPPQQRPCGMSAKPMAVKSSSPVPPSVLASIPESLIDALSSLAAAGQGQEASRRLLLAEQFGGLGSLERRALTTLLGLPDVVSAAPPAVPKVEADDVVLGAVPCTPPTPSYSERPGKRHRRDDDDDGQSSTSRRWQWSGAYSPSWSAATWSTNWCSGDMWPDYGDQPKDDDEYGEEAFGDDLHLVPYMEMAMWALWLTLCNRLSTCLFQI